MGQQKRNGAFLRNEGIERWAKLVITDLARFQGYGIAQACS
jgi:hypothetical protein